MFLYITQDCFLVQEEKVLHNFKSRFFPIKSLNKTLTREPTPELGPDLTKRKKSESKL